MQDVSGGQPVQLEGTDLPVWALEIDPDQAVSAFRTASAEDGGKARAAPMILWTHFCHSTDKCASCIYRARARCLRVWALAWWLASWPI